MKLHRQASHFGASKPEQETGIKAIDFCKMQNASLCLMSPEQGMAVPCNMAGTILAHIYFPMGLEMTFLVAFTGVPVYTIT